jgi:iron-sulfur cluster assembly protein
MIQLTELAAKKVKQQLEKRGKGLGIVVGVRPTGCSGLAYKLEYVDNPPVTRDYMTYDSNGIKIWVNGRDLPYIDGMTMDWKRNGLNEGFDFINEKEKDRCGCGESFRV